MLLGDGSIRRASLQMLRYAKVIFFVGDVTDAFLLASSSDSKILKRSVLKSYQPKNLWIV